MMGLQDFLRTVMKIKRRINPKLDIAGILLTMCEKRTTLCKVLTEEVTENFGEQIRVFETQIPSTVKVGESIYYGKPLVQYSPKASASMALLLLKYSMIMESDTELKRRNDELFKVERERGNLEIEASECTGVFKQKRRKELQEQIAILDKKAEKMKTELSKVLQNAGYTNAAEFYTELFMVREEKQKYEVACKEWQQECFEVVLEAKKDRQNHEDVTQVSRNRHR